jgi:biotin operon repressor
MEEYCSLADLAAMRGVSRQAISQNIKRWTKLGARIRTIGSGHNLKVDWRDYDAARAAYGEPGLPENALKPDATGKPSSKPASQQNDAH